MRLPSHSRLLGAGLLAVASLTLSACYVQPTGSYRSAYVDSGPRYVGGYDHVSVRRGSPFASYGYGPAHYGGYRGASPYTCAHGHRGHCDRCHHSCHGRRDRHDHGDGAIRLVDPSSRHRGRDIPDGWHDREWFERRGYDTNHDRFEDRAGHRFGRGQSHREAARHRH